MDGETAQGVLQRRYLQSADRADGHIVGQPFALLVRADTHKPQAINTLKIGSLVILRRDDNLPPDILKRLRTHRRVSHRARD
jgi:hypothetical protein